MVVCSWVELRMIGRVRTTVDKGVHVTEPSNCCAGDVETRVLLLDMYIEHWLRHGRNVTRNS